MVKLSINLSDVEVGDFEIVDAGKYTAEVTDVIEKESSSGHPMLVWDWKIVGGDFAGSCLKSYTTLQEHALFGLKEHLTAFGIEGDLEGFETDSMIGRTALITVTKNKIVSKDSGEDIDVNRVQRVAAAAAGKKTAKAKKMSNAEIPL